MSRCSGNPKWTGRTSLVLSKALEFTITFHGAVRIFPGATHLTVHLYRPLTILLIICWPMQVVATGVYHKDKNMTNFHPSIHVLNNNYEPINKLMLL